MLLGIGYFNNGNDNQSDFALFWQRTGLTLPYPYQNS